jgi:hypothetical protein
MSELNDAARRPDAAGLVAFAPCGHWWVYPVRGSLPELHEVVAFDGAVPCSFCLTEGEARQRVQARPVGRRVN